MTDATRYPLSWPFGWQRTAAGQRSRGKFSRRQHAGYYTGGQSYTRSAELTVPMGLDRLKIELDRLGARSTLISSNVELNSYGEPRGGRRTPDDPGVAVYFRLNGKDRVLACDRFDRVADNMAGIAAHIECLRGIDRYGVGTLDQAFAGYDALPPPGADNRAPWRTVLGLGAGQVTRADVVTAYREKAKDAHPDTLGGSHEAMAALNVARDAALQEVGG